MSDLTTDTEYQSVIMEISNLLADFFKTTEKAVLWLDTENPLLGHIAPRDMINAGRAEKLLKFIQTQLEENKL